MIGSWLWAWCLWQGRVHRGAVPPDGASPGRRGRDAGNAARLDPGADEGGKLCTPVMHVHATLSFCLKLQRGDSHRCSRSICVSDEPRGVTFKETSGRAVSSPTGWQDLVITPHINVSPFAVFISLIPRNPGIDGGTYSCSSPYVSPSVSQVSYTSVFQCKALQNGEAGARRRQGYTSPHSLPPRLYYFPPLRRRLFYFFVLVSVFEMFLIRETPFSVLRPAKNGGVAAEGGRADWQAALQRGPRPVPLEAGLVRAGGLDPTLQRRGRGRRGGSPSTQTAAGAQ